MFDVATPQKVTHENNKSLEIFLKAFIISVLILLF